MKPEEAHTLRLILTLSALVLFGLAVWLGYRGDVIAAGAMGCAAVADLFFMMWFLRSS